MLGLTAFDLAEADRAVYHAGATIASNYLVTLHQAASGLFEEAGAPPAGLEPLMRRVIGNGFELTGRSPAATGRRSSATSRRSASGSRSSSRSTASSRRRPRRESRPHDRGASGQRPNGTVGLVPTMGSFHDGHLSLFRAARGERQRRREPVRQPGAVRRSERPRRVSARGGARRRAGRGSRRRRALRPEAEELYPDGFETWVEVERLGSILEGEVRPGHFRGVATICLKLFNLVRPDRAYFGQKDAQQAAVVRRMVRDLNVPVEIRVVPTVRDDDGLALSSRNTLLSPDERRLALALPALSRPTIHGGRESSSTDSKWTTSRSPISSRRSSPPPCASAPLV